MKKLNDYLVFENFDEYEVIDSGVATVDLSGGDYSSVISWLTSYYEGKGKTVIQNYLKECLASRYSKRLSYLGQSLHIKHTFDVNLEQSLVLAFKQSGLEFLFNYMRSDFVCESLLFHLGYSKQTDGMTDENTVFNVFKDKHNIKPILKQISVEMRSGRALPNDDISLTNYNKDWKYSRLITPPQEAELYLKEVGREISKESMKQIVSEFFDSITSYSYKLVRARKPETFPNNEHVFECRFIISPVYNTAKLRKFQEKVFYDEEFSEYYKNYVNVLKTRKISNWI